MSPDSDRMRRIRERLATLTPVDLEVIDQSHLHVGHAGARDGKGHFDVRIVTTTFDGQSLLERHRSVYAALGDLMQTDIHAVSIQAHTPAEVARAQPGGAGRT